VRYASFKLLVFLAAVLANLPVLAFADQLGEFIGRRVVRVEVAIDGASGSTAEIESRIEVAAGDQYSPQRIRDSLARLYRLGLVSGARVEATAVGSDGVGLRFVVKPQARIDSVVFEGNTIIAPPDLRARITELSSGDRLSAGAVNAALDDLVGFYSSQGYYQAQITPEVRLDPSGTRAVVAYRIAPGEQATVARVTRDIRGEQVDLSKVKNALVEGEPFTQNAVGEEIERIRTAFLENDFLNVRLSSTTAVDMMNNSVAVTISGESGPRVAIVISGVDVGDDEKRELLPFYLHGGIDDFSLEEGRRRLLEYAQRQGYFFAEVARPALPDLSGSPVQIEYIVEPGSRYRLTDIDIEGLTAIPSAELQARLRSKEATPIPIPFFGFGRGVTSDDMLRQDSNLIQRQLRDLGYRRAQVAVRRGVSLTGENLLITFDVKEGPRSYIDQIDIRGNLVLTSAELRSRLAVEENSPLVTSEVNRGSDQLIGAYNNLGYATAEIVSELADFGSVNGQDRVRLIYNIAEGNRVRIRSITTRGAALTNVGRLERNFYLFKEGERLHPEKVQETERALYDTNAFSSVTIRSEPVARGPDGSEERDVTVDLLEAKRLLLIYGLGYQSNRSDRTVPGLDFLKGARGLIQLTNSNLLGRLYTGSAQVRVSDTELFGQLSFHNPRPFGENYPALISVFARRLAEKTFGSDRYTAVIQVERRLSHETIGYLSYNFERVSVYDHDGTIEDIERNRRPIILGRIGPSFLRDSRDSFSDPTSGQLTVGSFYVASSVLGGNEEFVRFHVEHNRYYQIARLRDTVYSVSARLGLASPFGGQQTLPVSERFFAGGSRDLRGFGFEEAGPRETVDIRDEEGNVIGTREVPSGGNAMFVINNELRFPIWGPLGGTVFSDTGNVFKRVKDFRIQDLTQTVGFGLRVKTPIGPVRFDLGFLVLNKPAGLPGHQRHFTLGQTF
jgi:outer membrane protein insertion porin family